MNSPEFLAGSIRVSFRGKGYPYEDGMISCLPVSSDFQCSGFVPVNNRNILKWFKRLQNVFKTYLNPVLWFSKRFQANVYAVMFKKRFINILY